MQSTYYQSHHVSHAVTVSYQLPTTPDNIITYKRQYVILATLSLVIFGRFK